MPPVRSLVDVMLSRLDDSFDRPAAIDTLAASEHAADCRWTWGGLIASAVAMAERLEAEGLGRGDRLAHAGTHGVEWIVVDLACLLSGVVHVALHADASVAAWIQQMRWLGVDAFASSGGCRRKAGGDLPARTVPIDPAAGLVRETNPSALRSVVDRRAAVCDAGACATIVLSSGTSGRPHGVLHCQQALLANASAAADVFLDEPNDVRLSWLPMSHVFARTGDLYTALVRGACLNVVTDRRRVIDACRTLPPTVVLGVPSFFEKIERATRAGEITDLAAALGGRVRVCVSGAAPLRQRTVDAFAARGVPLVQGYGLAEAGPVVAVANPRNARPGTVGPPLEGVQVRIDDRPESTGQVLVRTPSRAMGVILPEQPGAGGNSFDRSVAGDDARATSGDLGDWISTGDLGDWISTGDLGEIDDEGHLRITGRLVDTLVLAGGTKVPPAEVERAIAEDPAVAQVCVVGAGLPAPLALVVPDPVHLRAAVHRMGLRVFSRRLALKHPRVLAWLARRLARRQQSLPRGWRARRAVLVGRAFDAAHGEVTESLKLRRGTIAGNFGRIIEAAAASRPPAWMADIPAGCPQEASRTAVTARRWLAASLWGERADAAGDGFAEAALRAAAPFPDAVAEIVDHAERVIERLRGEGRLYETMPPAAAAVAPLDVGLGPPRGLFAAVAEQSLGEAGFWGLAVPEAYGGGGCTMLELARAVTRIAAAAPTAAGMLAVHSTIGAVSALTAFGSPEQRARHLPALAAGRPLSIFAATEPDAGCDLGAVRTRLERHDGRLVLTGTKMFITNATHGRLVKVLARDASGGGGSGDPPVVVLARLPDADTATFRLRGYGLHPLRHTHNHALEFTGFEVDESDVLRPHAPDGRPQDGMPIVWHGLNRGRVTLAAQAAGTLRLLLASAVERSRERRTWGRPIGSRQLVQGRLARIAAGIVACDALAAWSALAVDADAPGDLEAITAKVIAGQCVREAAIAALGVHGGRAFLVGHPWGDSLHDQLAVGVYEGESDLLGLALFKGLCRLHPAAAARRESSALRQGLEWLAWRAGGLAAGRRQDAGLLDGRLRRHARRARYGLSAVAVRIDRAMRRHGRDLAERQLDVGEWSAEVRDYAAVLAAAHHADAHGDEGTIGAADCWCRLALARARGAKPTADDHVALATLGAAIVEAGGCRGLSRA